MPEFPPDKGHLHPVRRPDNSVVHERVVAPATALHVVSCFSFHRGASHPDELVARAIELGYESLAITDVGSLAGVVRAHVAAKGTSLKLIIGSEVTLDDGTTLVILAVDRLAYGDLTRCLTEGRRRAPKGTYLLRRQDMERFGKRWLALVVPPMDLSLNNGLSSLKEQLDWAGRSFEGRVGLAVSMPDGADDQVRAVCLATLAQKCGVTPVAATPIEAHARERRSLRDTLYAIRHGCRVEDLGNRLPPNLMALPSPQELHIAYQGHEYLLENALEFSRRCQFSLSELRYEYPVEGRIEELVQLTRLGAKERWPHGVPERVEALLRHEWALIAELGYQDYFLTVHEIVAFARSRGILCQGRGSAANSAVCYCLGITSVDPDRFDVLFERFMSKDRHEPPDIDVDFEHERREEVLQHIYTKYGRERAALTAVVITYRGRSAVRDVGKALGLPEDQVSKLAETLRWWDPVAWPRQRLIEAGFDADDQKLQQVIAVSTEIHGFPRHLSQHVGGMVITAGRLDDMVPIENAAMEGRTVVEWDKDDLDALGILKIDCLALGMLTAIRRAFDGIARIRGERMDLASVPAEDPDVYDMACAGDTVGVFQIESRAQMSMLPRLQPRCFYDLVIEVAIVRPGPIQGGMVHPYLRRRAGEEQVTFPSEDVRSVLGKTLGVPIFQEQAMRLAVVAGGFTPGEADQLRRAMGAWRRPGLLNQFGEKLVVGMLERGYEKDFADALFRQITGFGEYGFPESHAASFALLTYVSLWLKRFEPAAFLVALLNSQPMGFYAPAQLVTDARRHGVLVLPIDVTVSEESAVLEVDATLRPREESRGRRASAYGRGGPAVRLGLEQISGLSRQAIARIVAARNERSFATVNDVCLRAELLPKESSLLAGAGAFRSLSAHRRGALWEATLPLPNAPLLESMQVSVMNPAPVPQGIPAPDRADIVMDDYLHTGLSLEAHAVSLLRPALAELGAVEAASLSRRPHRSHVAVAGLVLNRQRPATASGVLFMTLEDETGVVNVIVRLDVQERCRAALLQSSLALVSGRIERAHGVTHLLATGVNDVSDLLGQLPHQSRDFR